MVAARELLVLVLLAVAGAGVLPPAWSSRRRMAAAVPVGVALFSAVELVLLATGIAVAYPLFALLLAAVVGVLVGFRGRAWQTLEAPWVAGLGGTLLVVVVVTAALPLVNVTADSFRYASVAGLLTTGGSTTGASGFLLLSRSLVLGAVHGLAAPSLGYLRAIGPIVAVGTVLLTADLVRDGVRDLDPSVARLLEVGAALALATNHWFLFNALYVNGHLLFAVWLLLVAMITLDVVREPAGQHAAALVTVAVVAAALVILRPEGALVAGLAIAPVVVSTAVQRRWRGILLAATGLAVVLWHAAVLLPMFDTDAPDLRNVLAMSALGAGLVVASFLLPIADRVWGRLRHPLVWAHLAVWAVVVLGAVRSPSILRYSAIATLRNVTSDGLWGVSLWVLAGLVGWVLLTRRVPEQRVWVFPLATFVPLSLLLAFLRGGSYRIGPGDSLNRMLLHVLPLAVVTVALAAAGVPRRSTEGTVVGPATQDPDVAAD